MLFSRWFSRKKAPTSSRPRRFVPRFDFLEERELLATYLVTNTNDNGDGSLRKAINKANDHDGADFIRFNIPGGGIQTISLNSALPTIKERVTIDGYSQEGATANTLGPGQGTNANLLIELRPGSTGIPNGLLLNKRADGSVIQGLSIYGFTSGAGIALKGENSNFVKSVRLGGNFLGVRADGTPSPVTSNGAGVSLTFASGATIGGPANGDRNLISGNVNQGILLGASAQQNLVVNNLVGTEKTGTASRANGQQGILITGSLSQANTVGGTTAAARNVISGNTSHGVEVRTASAANLIQGNHIGLNAAGDAAVANQGNGVVIDSSLNTVVDRNVISGNGNAATFGGVVIGAPGSALLTQSVQVTGNLIGLNAAGDTAVANKGFGVKVGQRAINNTIGGANAGNVISGNTGDGIIVGDTQNGGGDNTAIQGNVIGLNAAGTLAIANTGNGVTVIGSVGTSVGGTAAGTGNVISGNGLAGVLLKAAANPSVGNSVAVQRNVIGLAPGGNLVNGNNLGNGQQGVFINQAKGVTIGGTAAGAGNVIAANTTHGVDVLNATAGALIQGNTIGLASLGTVAAGNREHGVLVNQSTNVQVRDNLIGANGAAGSRGGVSIAQSTNTRVAGNTIGLNSLGLAAGNNEFGVQVESGSGTTIGGTTAADRNLISGNTKAGIKLLGGSTHVEGNYIGTNSAGDAARPNGAAGVHIETNQVTVGGATAAARNVISGNATDGIRVLNVGSPGVQILGNYIGTNAAGDAAVANGNVGVGIESSQGVTIGGKFGGERNVISGNKFAGVVLDKGMNHLVAGNFIGTNAAGDAAVPNSLQDGFNGGVWLFETTNATIGGTTEPARNVISGNVGNGITIEGGTNAVVQGNTIGMAANGTDKLGNTNDGIHTFKSSLGNSVSNLTIGGLGTGHEALPPRNVISGNGRYGILVDHVNGFTILGNYIGTDKLGDLGRGNGQDGIFVSAMTSGGTIGGTANGARNLISGNLANGVNLDAGGPVQVLGNYIGTAWDGTGGIGNAHSGVRVNSTNNTVGGTAAGARNVISGNDGAGVSLIGNATQNTVAGNFIGLGATGDARPNGLGVNLTANSNTVSDNVISSNNTAGVHITGANNTLVRNFIGTSVEGDAFRGNHGPGVWITGRGATGNKIGSAADHNVISGNDVDGVLLDGGAQGNQVLGNYIGVNAAGTHPLGNGNNGVNAAATGATANTIGGTAAGAGNVIAGHVNNAGVLIQSQNTLVQGNTIGLNKDGQAAINGAALGNRVGVLLNGTPVNTTIGGTGVGAGNVIGGNTEDGIRLAGMPTNTLIQGNNIGLNAAGASAGNGDDGIDLHGAVNTAIGGMNFEGRNVISANGDNGVEVVGFGTTGTVITGNRIGTDLDGNAARGNGNAGVVIDSTSAAIGSAISGSLPGGRNIISGNMGVGVALINAANMAVVNNFIGLNNSGNAKVANGDDGILLIDTSHVTIGGLAGLSNFISGNAGHGIQLSGASTTLIQGNTIGLQPNAAQKEANGGDGIHVTDGSDATTIGGTAAGAGNIISGNAGHGVSIDASTHATQLRRNTIGLDGNANNALGNTKDGVFVAGGAVTIGGTAGVGNVISGNGGNGIQVAGAEAANTLIQGNTIGLNGNRTLDRGNALDGIRVSQADGVLIGGTATGDIGNVIAANKQHGIQVEESDDTLIQGNFIGTNIAAFSNLGNSLNGVQLFNTSRVTIGGTVAGAENTISGNHFDGINLSNAAMTLIAANRIGTDSNGDLKVANGEDGIDVFGTSDQTTIGQTGFGNVISGNSRYGVTFGPQATNLTLLANTIGLKLAGDAKLANGTGLLLSGQNAVVGTDQPGQGNLISGNTEYGIHVQGNATNIAIKGNRIGTDQAGTSDLLGNGKDGVLVTGGTGVVIGGAGAGEGNLVAGNNNHGIHLTGVNGVQIVGNRIGTDGVNQVRNALDGVFLEMATGSVIRTNVISGNGTNGVELTTNSNNNLIEANKIGVKSDGTTALGNGNFGVFAWNTSLGNTIGGTAANAGNIIANNVKGVVIGNSVTDDSIQNRILGNSIYANTSASAPGIDLGNNGATPNDNLDPDLGPNRLQNYPVLTAATVSGSDLTVTGTLNSIANRSYRIEFFATDVGGPGPNGQGKTFLGFIDVTTDGSGDAAINTVLLGVNVPAGQVVTATATDTTGNTSEFSAWITAV